MEINWSTFVFEIINFIVLVWILKRFLYQPVLDMISRRRQAIDSEMALARQQQIEANTLKEQYEHRLSDWEQERRQAMNKLKTEIEDIRHKQMEKLKLELADQEEKSRVARERQDTQFRREINQRALHQGAEFASRLLAEAAGPELESRLIELLLEELKALPDDIVKSLASHWETEPDHTLVSSAFPLAGNTQRQLQAALQQLTGKAIPVEYKQDETLLAGLSISVGSFLLQLNIREELRGFAELADVES